MITRALLAACLAAVLAACGSSYAAYDPYDLQQQSASTRTVTTAAYGGATNDVASIGEAVTLESYSDRSRGGRAQRSSASASAPPPAPSPMPQEAPAPVATEAPLVATNGDVPPLERDAERRLPLLIYTGNLTLAIYDVEATKEAAIATIEEFGGYASQRTANTVVLRVPAEHFRAALDALEEHGDVLQVTWSAADVGDEFHDLEVRLRNAQNMRDRLEDLLLRVETVSDALAIERELERITLEIERIEGQRRQMIDRIAFATIHVNFSVLPQSAVPGEEYRLPFHWLNQIGVERLLNL